MTNKPRFRMHADGQVSMMIGDGFANMVTGLGLMDLKASANTYVMPVTTPELEAAYRTSTWFGKIIDIPAKDGTREWRKWQADNAQIELLEATEKRLGVQQKILQAWTWKRLYGGAAIIIGGLPGTNWTPLRLDSVRKDSIKFLNVLSKDELIPNGIIRNPLDPDYGKPAYWTIASEGTGARIHPSRVVDFNGRKVSPLSALQDYWGDPEWYRLEAAVKSADSTGAVIDALMQESKVDVIRVNGMTKSLATAEYEALMIRRFQMVALLKGMQNVMLMDKDDEWEQKQIDWTGVPDIAKHVLNILSGASDIPMFRLTGQNLTGLNNTGDGEQRAYYDGVRADQKLGLQPDMNVLDEVLIRCALGTRPANVWYEWNSLYQMSEKERAEVDKLRADASLVYVNTGMIPEKAMAKAVQSRMIDSGDWPSLESALDELTEEERNMEGNDPDADTIALLTAAMARNPAQAAGGDDPPQPAQAQVQQDAAPRALYIRRDVLNADEILRWAKANGFETTVPASALHVTVLYSKTPVDWMELPAPWDEEVIIPAGGARLMERFGDDGSARVLTFKSENLKWRHEYLIEAGASSSHDKYQAHITISWNSGLDGEEATWPMGYNGEIRLGPEIWEPIDENWRLSLTEDQEV